MSADDRIKIGIYGGTFSPPHIGHINAALAFDDQIKPQKLFIIPTAIPPHKRIDDGDNPVSRLQMARLAFEGLRENIIVSDYEVEQAGRSYTYLTLEHFTELYPIERYRITFLCGTDMFLTLGDWVKPERIFALADIAFMRREKPDSDTDEKINRRVELYKERFGATVTALAGEAVEAASTELRMDIAAGGDGMGMIPPKVLNYIRENGLYTERH